MFLNHLIILIKYMIYKARSKASPPIKKDIYKALIESKEEERKKVIHKNRLALHFKKWELFNFDVNGGHTVSSS